MSGARPESKTVIVTGAGSGIGAATATTLAAGGWRVALFDVAATAGRAVAHDIDLAGGDALFERADVADEASVVRAVAAVREQLGPPVALVNNAGTIADSAPVLEQTWEQWQRIVNVNAGGTFLCTRAVLPDMLAAGGGAIVNVASISGLVGLPGQSAYCMSKGAIVQLTRQVTADYAARGIRCNAVCPGSIETPLLAQAAAQDPAILDTLRAGHPAGRLGRSEEIATVVAFLLSDAASFMNGAIVSADGGFVAV